MISYVPLMGNFVKSTETMKEERCDEPELYPERPTLMVPELKRFAFDAAESSVESVTNPDGSLRLGKNPPSETLM